MPIVLFTSKNLASLNIAEELRKNFRQVGDDKWMRGDAELIDTNVDSVLDIPTDFRTNCLVVLSPHKSKEGKPMLTVHVPGNWDSADFGGAPRTLNIACASKMAGLLRNIKKYNDESGLGFDVVFEVDHHGPTCSVPIIFVEIGSSEKEWANKEAAKVIANAVLETISEPKTQDTKQKTVFGVGGGHYAKEFSEIALSSDMLVGHILPKYKIDALREDMFKQAIEKNTESVQEVLALKSINSEQKKKVKSLCNKFDVRYTEHEVD